jgi:hypothetical protein
MASQSEWTFDPTRGFYYYFSPATQEYIYENGARVSIHGVAQPIIASSSHTSSATSQPRTRHGISDHVDAQYQEDSEVAQDRYSTISGMIEHISLSSVQRRGTSLSDQIVPVTSVSDAAQKPQSPSDTDLASVSSSSYNVSEQSTITGSSDGGQGGVETKPQPGK